MTPEEHERRLVQEVHGLVGGLSRTVPLRAQQRRFGEACRDAAGAPPAERYRAMAAVLRDFEAELHAWSASGDPYTKQYARLFAFAVRVLELEAERQEDEAG